MTTDFAQYISSFFVSYLPGQRNLSANTIKAYRDAVQLLLAFCRDEEKLCVEHMMLVQVDKALIERFILWLEAERGNSISTRNQRLAAIHSFYRYVQFEAPEHMVQCQQVLGVPFKRKPKPAVCYLTHDQMKEILSQPSTKDSKGRRDLLLLSLLYDTGGRVQEIADLTVRNIRLDEPATIMLTGKGSKSRYVPIMGNTAGMLRLYLQERRLNTPDKYDHPLFFNAQRTKLTRVGITYVLNKYVDMAKDMNDGFPAKVTPHVLRHTKAMHLLEAGVNLIYIRDLLGHVSVTTTETYARANPEMKRTALEKASLSLEPEITENWEESPSLVSWLQGICRTN